MENKGFSFEYLKFEISNTHPNRDDKYASRYIGINFM